MSSLTFGPKWVRDLSSGDSGAAAPPNTPPPRKYKLAEFRYGREEMLALLAEDYEIPLGLKDFEDIINERPVQPLAFVDVSEEEERCLIGGVNSLLVLKMTGRSGPGMRARGVGRVRGRGRGEYSLHRSQSTSDEIYNQRHSWNDTGLSRGGYHRPVGRGGESEGAVRGGYEPRGRLQSEGAQSQGKPGEYWRSNSLEQGSNTPEEGGGDGWRTMQGTKPWAGKKGFADNNKNWRDSKEPGLPPGQHDGISRSKSWSQKTHDKDQADSGGLPEWCNDDSFDDNTPGSFDASGQFCSFRGKEDKKEEDQNSGSERFDNDKKDSAESTQKKPLTVEEVKDNIRLNRLNSTNDATDAKCITENIINDIHMTSSNEEPEKEPPQISASNKETDNLDSENLSQVLDPVKENENEEAVENWEDNLSEDGNLSEGDNLPEPSKTEHLPEEAVVSTTLSDETVQSEPVENILNVKKINKQQTEEDLEMNLDHIKSMVMKLDEDSESEEIIQQEYFHHQEPVQQSQVMDPSIVFAKKAEPGKSFNGMQDWIYRDPQGEIRGPFSNDEMLEWFKAGYFTMGLSVRRICDEMFLPLGDVIKLWGRIPFTGKTQPPPITSQVLLQHQQHQQQQQQQNQLQRLVQQQQQQQQQQMRQVLLHQLKVSGMEGRPTELNLQPEVTVWGDISTGTTPKSLHSPWTPMQEQNVWNNRKSPQNALNLQEIENEQLQHQKAEMEMKFQEQVERLTEEDDNTVNEGVPNQQTPSEESREREIVSGEKGELKGETNSETKAEEGGKKKNKKKNKINKENESIGASEKASVQDQKQKEKEELRRKAMESLKQQQMIQQQQKLAEQQQLINEQNRREEEIRHKQQQQQQQMQQQIMMHQYQQEQQRKQKQMQQQSTVPSWNRITPTSNAPSLAEIQQLQERKEAEERLRALQQHEQMIQQQQQQRAQARWQQQNLQQGQQRSVKSLLEIQAEEAKILMKKEQVKQQQLHHLRQQQQQNLNQLAWNAAGQPIAGKQSRKHDPTAMFWDDVMGLPSRPNGNIMNAKVNNNQQRRSYNDFPPMSVAGSAANKVSSKALKDNKEQEIVNRLFQAPTPSSDFVQWVDRKLPKVKKLIDVPTVVAFLQEVESSHEVDEYMKCYLGDTPDQKEFVREFLDRRRKKQSISPGNNKSYDSIQSSNGLVADDDADGDSKRGKKKKKMQKLNPTLLGFQCNAAPELVNRAGEIESVANAPVKSGKK